MTKVHCTVSDCGFWQQSNLCDASEILITGFPVPQVKGADVDHHGRGAEKMPKSPADRKDGTYCYTFEKEEHAAGA